jgi:hypothetical protein
MAQYKSDDQAETVSERYRIVLHVGDQINDLVSNPQVDRLVKLPNPFYFITVIGDVSTRIRNVRGIDQCRSPKCKSAVLQEDNPASRTLLSIETSYRIVAIILNIILTAIEIRVRLSFTN